MSGGLDWERYRREEVVGIADEDARGEGPP